MHIVNLHTIILNEILIFFFIIAEFCLFRSILVETVEKAQWCSQDAYGGSCPPTSTWSGYMNCTNPMITAFREGAGVTVPNLTSTKFSQNVPNHYLSFSKFAWE